MKKTVKKLVLAKETVRTLEDLKAAAGGMRPKYTMGDEGTECALDTQGC